MEKPAVGGGGGGGEGIWKGARRRRDLPESSADPTRGNQSGGVLEPLSLRQGLHTSPQGREIYDGEAVWGLLIERWFDQH